MLRLLFSTVAILPIGVISFMANTNDTLEPVADEATYAELVTDPKLESLMECETTTLPVYFEDEDVTLHSAAFIEDGLNAVEGCGDVEITVVPVLPDYADAGDVAESALRAAELVEQVESSESYASSTTDVDIAEEPREEDVSTLYINGRAAILRIEPDATSG